MARHVTPKAKGGGRNGRTRRKRRTPGRRLEPDTWRAPGPDQPGREASPDEFGRLAALQLDLLQAFGAPLHLNRRPDYPPILREAEALASAHGFPLLGGGSTRVAVGLTNGVAKLSFSILGLAFNLQEATSWLALPSNIRRHMVPGIVLTPALVFVQQQVEVLGPPLTEVVRDPEAAKVKQGAVLRRFRDGLCAGERGLGYRTDPTEFRLDNWGHLGDRLVRIDYAEIWRPLEAVWAWVVERLEDGPLWLTPAARARLYEQIAEHGGYWSDGEPFTGRLLLRLAGWRPEEGKGCPCARGCRRGARTQALCWLLDDTDKAGEAAVHSGIKRWERRLGADDLDELLAAVYIDSLELQHAAAMIDDPFDEPQGIALLHDRLGMLPRRRARWEKDPIGEALAQAAGIR